MICDRVIALDVSVDGTVGLTQLQTFAALASGRDAKQLFECIVWARLSQFVNGACRIPLDTLCFGHSGANLRHVPSFWMQLISSIAVRSEATLVLAERRLASDGIRIELPDGDGEWSCRDIDKTCVRHVKASRETTRGEKNFGLATNKAFTRGFDVQNAFMTLPSNVAFELVPQVSELSGIVNVK